MVYRILMCIFIAGLTLYAYIDKKNTLTELRLAIPTMQKEVKRIQIENTRIQYEIDCFENPLTLMELSQRPEYGHLHYPTQNEVVTIPEGVWED